MQSILDKYNAIVGAVVVFASAVLGQFWYLFAFYLLFNVLDWITGTYRANKLKIESSEAGWEGLKKKSLSWVIIIIAFAVPPALIPFGEQVYGVDLSILDLVGWFVLASLMINELRSICENLVEAGIRVPGILTSGLAVTQKLLQSKADSFIPDDKGESE